MHQLPHRITGAQTTHALVKAYLSTKGLMLNSKKTQSLFVVTRALINHIPDNTTITFANTSIKPSKHVRMWASIWTVI